MEPNNRGGECSPTVNVSQDFDRQRSKSMYNKRGVGLNATGAFPGGVRTKLNDVIEESYSASNEQSNEFFSQSFDASFFDPSDSDLREPEAEAYNSHDSGLSIHFVNDGETCVEGEPGAPTSRGALPEETVGNEDRQLNSKTSSDHQDGREYQEKTIVASPDEAMNSPKLDVSVELIDNWKSHGFQSQEQAEFIIKLASADLSSEERRMLLSRAEI